MFFNWPVKLTTPDQCAVSNKTSRHFITVQNQNQNLFTFSQRSGGEKTDALFNSFDLSWEQTEQKCETFRFASPTSQRFRNFYWRRWTVLGDLFDISNVRPGTIAGQTNVKVGFDIAKWPIITFVVHLKICKTGPVLSNSGTGTRFYINDLCMTAIEKANNLQGWIYFPGGNNAS